MSKVPRGEGNPRDLKKRKAKEDINDGEYVEASTHSSTCELKKFINVLLQPEPRAQSEG